MRAVSSAAVVCLVLLAGCVGDERVSVVGNGQKTGSETKHLECGDDGHIAVMINGQGTVSVTVSDGAGAELYRESFTGNGQVGEEQTLHGARGHWTLHVAFTGPLVGGFNGQYSAVLSC